MNKILHYDIAEKLGEGPNGPSWLAIDSGFQRAVVVKNLNRDFVTHDPWRVSFLEQMEKLNGIEDFRIAHFFSLENAEQQNFIVREYIDGKTVTTTVKDRPIDYHRWVELALELAAIVKVIHDSGAFHGNLTGSNVLLDARERIRLLDAGLATPSNDQTSTSPSAFIAPELRAGGPITIESDLYAVGAILYQMITGQPPSVAGDTQSSPVSFDRFTERQVPGIARLVIERLLEEKPEERFTSADELIVTLQTMLSLGAESGVEFLPKKSRLTSRQYLGVAMLVLLLIILWLVITSNPR
jgi:serine/threonine protein kinase